MKFAFLIFLLLIIIGCGKEKDVPLPLGPEISEGANFEGVTFIDTENGISFKYYPEYKETRRNRQGVIFSKENGIERIVLIVWPLDIDTYRWYKDAFSNPLTLKRRLKKELKVIDEVLSYRILEKKGADAFLFTTKRPGGLYIQRLELFPKEQPLQISIFFWHEKENESKVLDMIGSIKIVKK